MSRNNRMQSYDVACSSGPGGQHVNKADWAARATHSASGISVKVQSERSQHANKRLARLLIAWKLEQQQQENSAVLKCSGECSITRYRRGNPSTDIYRYGFYRRIMKMKLPEGD
ncbi:peptide chain release factor-like protein [Escherichia coli]